MVAVNEFATWCAIRLTFKKFSIRALHCRPLYIGIRPILIRVHVAYPLLCVDFDPYRYLFNRIFIHDTHLEYHFFRAYWLLELVNCDYVLFGVPIELHAHGIIEVSRIGECQILDKFSLTDDNRGPHEVDIELDVATAVHQGEQEVSRRAHLGSCGSQTHKGYGQ